jgi:hypothetical protein
MIWKNIKLSPATKIFKVHHFTCLSKGSTYRLEVDESPEGLFTGHGEHTSDSAQVLKSVSANSLEDCVQKLLASIDKRD